MTWAVHTIDHIIAEKHGGPTAADNLALACMICNSWKGSDLASIDEQTGSIEPLFHPRRDRWTDHFQLVGGCIEPRTPKGRATAGYSVSTTRTVSRARVARRHRIGPSTGRVTNLLGGLLVKPTRRGWLATLLRSAGA